MRTRPPADATPDDRIDIPAWLRIGYTSWFAFWVPTYWRHVGPANFLWLCDTANFVILLAFLRRSRLILSAAAVGVLLIQSVWIFDFLGRLVLGFHPIGGTEYMFDPTRPTVMRTLSLFHVWVPAMLVVLIRRFGYDRRGLVLQAAISAVVLPLSFLADPERNLNWLWQPFGIEQTLMPPAAFLAIAVILYPTLLYLPAHALLRRWAPVAGAVRTPAARDRVRVDGR